MSKMLVLSVALLSPGMFFGQKHTPFSFLHRAKTARDTVAVKKDSATAAVLPYDKVITADAITRQGMFNVHQVKDKYYFELPNTLFHRDLLVVNRVSKGNSLAQLYAGDQIGGSLIRFVRGPRNKLYIEKIPTIFNATDSSANGMHKALESSMLSQIIYAFDIKAFRPDSSAVVIDVSDLLNSDNSLVAGLLKGVTRGVLETDKSTVVAIKTFPSNVEVRSIKTFKLTGSPVPGGPIMEDYLTLEVNASFLLLPAVPMHTREVDARVGYFGNPQVNFDEDPQQVTNIEVAQRWRLEPKPDDKEKYRRGELVEPQQPIVFYIDPTTPRKWVPYLIQGINDWQLAFEKAGFKNAIIGKEAPVNDSTWSMEDARNSVIVYKPSAISNAMGPNMNDPRTGEILESHVSWYHNVMKLLHNWYMVQAGAIDPRARHAELDDTLMGQLIRFVSSHEIGHTLGLAHNFGASSTVPVDSLRSKQWVEAHGHTPSIMDYARFNYVAQPEDHIGEKGIFPRIGEYDQWAIEWGYRCFPDAKSPEEEKTLLHHLTTARLSANRRLFFSNNEAFGVVLDPRTQTEDLGDDAGKAGLYGTKNLKRIIGQLPAWTKKQNQVIDPFNTVTNSLVGDELAIAYRTVLSQFVLYIQHAVRYFGTAEIDIRSADENAPAGKAVPQIKLKDAMSFITTEVLQTPSWLLNNETVFRAEQAQGGPYAISLGNSVLEVMLMESKLSGVNTIANKYRMQTDTYTLNEYLNDLQQAVWSELNTHQSPDKYRLRLQNLYIALLGERLRKADDPLSNYGDIYIAVWSKLRELKTAIKKALPSYKNPETVAHLQFSLEKINRLLNPSRAMPFSAPRNSAREGAADALGIELQKEPDALENILHQLQGSFTTGMEQICGQRLHGPARKPAAPPLPVYH